MFLLGFLRLSKIHEKTDRLVCLTISSVHKDCSDFLNSIDEIIIDCFIQFFERCKEYNSSLISLLSFSELFLLVTVLKRLIIY